MLPQCEVSVETKSFGSNKLAITLTNRGEWAAVNIRLTAPNKAPMEQSWQDNFFSIAPGGTRKIILTYTGNAPSVIAISGWNLQENPIVPPP